MIVRLQEPSINLWLKVDEKSNQVLLMDDDKYLGFIQWTPDDGLYFYSSKMKGDTLPLYAEGKEVNGYKQEEVFADERDPI